MSEDLRALDGSALVQRLVAVKKRVLELMDPVAPAALADTEAVLDECAVRLAEPDGVQLAGAGATIDRLRGLLRQTVMHEMGAAPAAPWCPRCDGLCWWCAINLEPADGAPDPHRPGCPWPALMAEAGSRDDLPKSPKA